MKQKRWTSNGHRAQGDLYTVLMFPKRCQMQRWFSVVRLTRCHIVWCLLSLTCVYSGLVNNADLVKEKLYTNLTTWISSHQGWPGYHHYWSWWLHSRDKSWAPDTPPHSMVTRHLGASCYQGQTRKESISSLQELLILDKE